MSLFVQGILDDVIALNNDSFVDVCNVFPFMRAISNGQGGTKTGFASVVTGIPCRLDDIENKLLPEKAKDNIDTIKEQRTIYMPFNTFLPLTPPRMIDIQDEIESAAGSPVGAVIRYRVTNVVIESQETDIALLVEVVY